MKEVKRYNLPVINKYQGCHVQHDKYSQHCSMPYMKIVTKINLKFSSQKTIFSVFNFYLHKMLDIHYNCDNHFMCISQIIMLYTLKLFSVCLRVLVAGSFPTLYDPMTVARQIPLSMEFSRQE